MAVQPQQVCGSGIQGHTLKRRTMKAWNSSLCMQSLQPQWKAVPWDDIGGFAGDDLLWLEKWMIMLSPNVVLASQLKYSRGRRSTKPRVTRKSAGLGANF